MATIAAAVLYPAASAQAGTPVTARAAAAPLAPCGPGVVTPADRAIAEQLRPAMNGPRLGSSVNGRSIACARAIVSTVQARGLGPRAAVIAVTTAIAESTLNNHTVAYDHDSVGLFQQRPSQGWGRPAQLVDVEYATNAFLNSMLRKHPGDSWMTGDIGAICQRVQRSAYPLAYAPEVHDAQLIVAQLWARAATPAPMPAAPAPAPSSAQPAAPSGPYQKALIMAGTELGALTGRHELALADWNADKHPDLILVRGTETATGSTEVRIMDGATNFSSLLLTTSTALGPTDERYAYAVTDWNGDNRPDLLVVQRSGTAGGGTEVTVLDGASSFRQVLLARTGTALAATDERHQFAVADWNGDNRPDLVVTQTSGTAGGKMEVQVLDGASGFQRALAPVIVTAEPANADHRVAVTDFNGDKRPDVVVIQKSLTADGKTQLRVLDGAANLQRQQSQADTAPGVSAHLDLLITEWNGDRKPDVMMVQKTGTASGRTELVVLGG
ncbi:VCBS repeat-containing protein [Actinoplanes sp. NPDC023801]|uniref:FG-GAP repeat domain-containing protein n=1 Tax=Actinoplanes sp. NPDC023801 TaxID=3154595 RepID=UPI0033EAA81E